MKDEGKLPRMLEFLFGEAAETAQRGHASLNTVMIYTGPTTQDLANRMQRVETNSR